MVMASFPKQLRMYLIYLFSRWKNDSPILDGWYEQSIFGTCPPSEDYWL